MDAARLAAWVDAFQRDGFVHCEGAVPGDEIARYRIAVDAAVAARKRFDTRALAEKSAYEQSFIQCQYLWEDRADVRPLTFHPIVGEIAAALLGAARVRLWHDQALYKEAGGRETEAHQDHPYWPIAERDTLTVWIPLVAVSEENGRMGYVPGSHRGDATFIDIFTKTGEGGQLLERHAHTPPVFVSCKPGDLLFHHGLTVHLARPNASRETRAAYTAIYFRDGCTRSGTMPHPSVDRDGIADGAVINGRATPIAWPLPDGRLPEPAPWPKTGSKRSAYYARMGVIPGEGS